MYPDSLLLNVVLFALGQFAAFGYLRTGLVVRGTWILIATWVFADLALVLRLAYQTTGPWYVLVLSATQTVSVVAMALFVYGRVRRKRRRIVARRDRLFREAFVAYLRDEIESAVKIYRKLLRWDPWDVPVRVALATALDKIADKRGRTKRLWRSVRSLDTDGQFRGVVEQELARLAVVGTSARRD